MSQSEYCSIHIIVRHGMVVGVYDYGHPEVGDICLREEFDYKVEYLDDYEDMDKEQAGQ